MELYTHYISLGYFCEVAGDLEKLGLRDTSSPFDWMISSFEGIIKVMDNRFKDFMNYDNLYKLKTSREKYWDSLYDCYFFHDFSKYKSLKKQYNQIKTKYDKRIERFLKNITEPTLFVRYINNENKLNNGKSTELDYIEKNREYILRVLRSYNSKNDIIFIANNDILDSKIIKIYKVKPDDIVSRAPILNNYELYPKISKIKTQH